MPAAKKDDSKAGVALTPNHGKKPVNAASFGYTKRGGGGRVAVTPMIIGPSRNGFAKAPIDIDRTVIAEGGNMESILGAIKRVIQQEGGADQVTAVHLIVRSVVEPEEVGERYED